MNFSRKTSLVTLSTYLHSHRGAQTGEHFYRIFFYFDFRSIKLILDRQYSTQMLRLFLALAEYLRRKNDARERLDFSYNLSINFKSREIVEILLSLSPLFISLVKKKYINKQIN